MRTEKELFQKPIKENMMKIQRMIPNITHFTWLFFGLALYACNHVRNGLAPVASGGIASIANIQHVLDLSLPNLIGIISGKAIYENKIDVAQAVGLCRAG